MGISRQDALDCFKSDDLIGIGMEADAIRRNLHPEGVVTYVLDGTIDYAAPEQTIYNKIEEIEAKAGTGITLHGSVDPNHTITWFETLFKTIKKRYPALHLHSLSATEIIEITRLSSLTLQDTLARLKDAGLDSIPGNDAGILDDAVQNPQSTLKAADWIAVHRTAHKLGLQTTATMRFGGEETFEHRVNHLERVRQLQAETGGFTAFAPSCLEPQPIAMQGFEEPTAIEQLKTLAISRMVLDNIENIQSNLETQGLKVLQVALRFGSNDVGSVLLPEAANTATEEQLRQVIRDAGFRPMQRDTLYHAMFLN